MDREGHEASLPGRWNRRQRDLGIALWMAFLAACVGIFILFALIDPNQVSDDWVLDWHPGIRMVYGLAFFFLFAVGLLAALLTAFMIRTGPGKGHASGQGGQKPPSVHHPARGNPDLEDEDWY